MSKVYHPYHLVDPSPWPYASSIGALLVTAGSVLYFHYSYTWVMGLGITTLIITMVSWWRDIIRESTFQGRHTQLVKTGLKYGVILFIISEICFFFAFFWAFFYSSLSPAIELGAIWPPIGVGALDPLSTPLLNTAVLLSSGATVTWAHHALSGGQRLQAIQALTFTVALGVKFTMLQAIEYYGAPFAISDSVYGSIFFVATGFHGFHVIIGVTFLVICLIRLVCNHYTQHRYFGFEAAIWYWHFVDVVWLFLYICVYWWGF